MLQESSLTNIFFVCADVNGTVFQLARKMPTTYKKFELKGQQTPTKKVLQNVKSQADFPYTELKCMRRDVTEQELTSILKQQSWPKLLTAL